MRKSGFSLLSLVAGVCLLPTAAFAQDAPAAPPAAPPPAAEPAPAPAPAPADAAPAAPAAAAEPAPAPAPPAPAEAAPAAPTFPATTIGGYVEGAYHRMLGSAHIGQPVATRAYDSSNGFLLHAAHLAIKHQLNENVYGVIEFDAGADARYNQGFNPGNTAGGNSSSSPLFDVQEAYGVATGSGFTFTAGKFATYEGIELIEGPTDPTITRGFLYWLAEPVTHVGAKLHYTAGPVDVGVGVVNGWDTNNALFNTGDNNNKKTFIWRVGVTPSPMFFAGISGTYGVEQADDSDARLSVDLTGAIIPTDYLTINFQGNVGSEKNVALSSDPTKTSSWYGFGLQPVLKSGAMSLGGRFEVFKDKNGSRTGIANDPTLINLTITPGYTIASAFTVRGELRYDHASEPVLSQAPSGGKKGQGTMALSASYSF